VYIVYLLECIVSKIIDSFYSIKDVFGTASRILLHKLHPGAASQKHKVCGVSL
jgi:hypothetical protein